MFMQYRPFKDVLHYNENRFRSNREIDFDRPAESLLTEHLMKLSLEDKCGKEM